jgi:predicted Zn-dependent protease
MGLYFVAILMIAIAAIETLQKGNYLYFSILIAGILLGIIEYINSQVLQTIYKSEKSTDKLYLIKFVILPLIMNKNDKEWYWDYKGTKYYFENKYELAITYLSKCIKADNYNRAVTSLVFCIKSYIALNKLEEATVLFNELKIKVAKQKEDTTKLVSMVENEINKINVVLETNKKQNG